MSELLPRWLTADEAARYIGLPGTEGFRRAVRRGTLPAASYRLGKQSPRWDRHALDRAMGAEEHGGVSDMEASINAVVNQSQAQAEDRPQAPRGRHYSRVSL